MCGQRPFPGVDHVRAVLLLAASGNLILSSLTLGLRTLFVYIFLGLRSPGGPSVPYYLSPCCLIGSFLSSCKMFLTLRGSWDHQRLAWNSLSQQGLFQL